MADQFLDYPAPTEQTLCYRAVASNAGGEAPPSNTDCTAVPAAPSLLTARLLDTGTIELTWSDNSSVEDGYEIRVYENRWSELAGPTAPELIAVLADLPPNVTTYRTTPVPADTSSLYYSSPPYFVVLATRDRGSPP